jgi:hypothetical protein
MVISRRKPRNSAINLPQGHITLLEVTGVETGLHGEKTVLAA